MKQNELNNDTIAEIKRQVAKEFENQSNNPKKSRRFMLKSSQILTGTILLFLGFSAALIAQNLLPDQFQSGELLTADKLNRRFTEVVPIKTIVAWHKDLPGGAALPSGWVECNGQILNDGNSTLNGQEIPNLNGHPGGANSPDMSTKERLYLRGNVNSGGGELDAFQGHWHILQGVDGGEFLERKDVRSGTGSSAWATNNGGHRAFAKDAITDNLNNVPRTADETRVKSMAVVWIMRVK